MNPVKKYGFVPYELGKVVFLNISAVGIPVKTAIFLGGLEFETWSGLFMKRHGRNDYPGWNEKLINSILKEKKLFLLPELTQGSGQFPGSKARITEDGKDYFFNGISSEPERLEPSVQEFTGTDIPPCFSDYEKSFAVLRISLVMQTLTALERAGIEKGYEVYTEGGFRKDEVYSRLLSSALAENRVFLTDIKEATALGAAMTAKMAISGKSLKDLSEDFSISYIEQEKSSFPELETYRRAWLAEALAEALAKPLAEADKF